MRPIYDIIIIGCGLGGLAAAIAIRKAGHRVTVYERAPNLAEASIGAGIQLPANCTRILKKWDLLPIVESISVRPTCLVLRSYKSGKALFRQKARKDSATLHLLTHRADFLKVLAQKALDLGVTIHFGSTVSDIDFNKSSVKFSEEEEIQCDVVFGADGQKSRCRKMFFSRPDHPTTSGDLACRIVLPVATMQNNEKPTVMSRPAANTVNSSPRRNFRSLVILPSYSSRT
ncbi:MAG: hypothetical protein MMC33_001933 [Icmadophila ericetorum]|nr:hypothetical protein [Icmadophila ericetorum]